MNNNYQMINELIKKLQEVDSLPISQEEKEDHYYKYIHDIEVCLYRIKEERLFDE